MGLPGGWHSYFIFQRSYTSKIEKKNRQLIGRSETIKKFKKKIVPLSVLYVCLCLASSNTNSGLVFVGTAMSIYEPCCPFCVDMSLIVKPAIAKHQEKIYNTF